jgi:hypothetical protein
VISARPTPSTPRYATALRRTLARLIAVSALATIASGAACGATDSPSATAREASAGTTARIEGPTPPREVIIAVPSSRYVAEPVASAGSVTGTISASADLKPGAPVSTGRDSAECGPSIPDESVVRQGSGLGGAVVWLDDIRRGKDIPLERRLELEIDKCRLVPRVQAGVVGSAVNVIAHDPFREHLHFLAGGEPGPRASVLLGQDEQVIPTNLPFSKPGLVIVKDSDHPWPTAYLAVFDHPYFAVTAPNGTFTIDGVPPGHYTVKVWHERTKLVEKPVDVAAGGAARVDVELQAK